MLNVKDEPVLCRKVSFLRLGKDDCKDLYNNGSMSQSIFYSAVGVDCRPSSGHDAILEGIDYFCYILSAKEAMRIVDEDRLPHSALTRKAHKFRKNNIRFLKNQLTAIEKEAKKDEADSYETNEHLKPMTDVELLKTLHEATSDRLKLLIEINILILLIQKLNIYENIIENDFINEDFSIKERDLINFLFKNKINYQNYIPNRKHNIKYIGYMRFVMISLKVWNLQIHHYSIVGFSIQYLNNLIALSGASLYPSVPSDKSHFFTELIEYPVISAISF